MKILQITNYFYPAISFGGPVQYTYNLSKYLTKLGHEVTVYTTNALELHTNKKISNKRKKINGIDVHYLPFIIRPYGYFIVPEIISKILKNVKLFDIVHLHEYRTFQNMIFYLFKKDIPYVVHLHGELLYKKEKLDVFLLRRTYENLFTNKFLNCASRIFALTKYEFSQLVKLGYEKRKISIVPNAVSPDRFIITSHKNTFKKYLNIENDRIILYVGRIYKYKGLDTLLEAFYYLSKKYNDIKLIIVGPDWGYLRYLINMIKHYDLKNKVIFTGVLDGELLSAAYNEASVVVNPSMQEGFPTILLEAGLFSKPIILTDNPSIYSFKKNNLCITIEYRNVNQLQKALTKVLENPKKHRYIGKKLHDYVNQNFTWKKVSKDIESLYYDIIKVN